MLRSGLRSPIAPTSYGGSSSPIIKNAIALTQSAYNALVTAGTVDPTTEYTILASSPATLPASATKVYYNGTIRYEVGLPVNTVAPSISSIGDVVSVGTVFTRTTGTWTNTPSSYATKWQRFDGTNWVDIGGATGSTYTTTGSDADKNIRCVVTASNGGGAGTPANSNVIGIVGVPVIDTVPVAVKTSATVYDCGTGVWIGAGTLTYAYQWKRNGTNISGATSATYNLVPADFGASITCAVTASNTGGAGTPSTSNTLTAGDPLNQDGLIALWDASDASTETVQLNQTFTSSDVNTTSGNLTVTLPFGYHNADPNSGGNLATEVFFSTTGTLPAPLVANTPYYIRQNLAGTEYEVYPKNSPTDGGTIPFTVPEDYIPPCMNFRLAVNKIAISTGGTGTHTAFTNPLLTRIPNQSSVNITWERTSANYNDRVELLTAGDGKKYLDFKGVLGKLINGQTTLEGVSRKLDTATPLGAETAAFCDLFRNKRFFYLTFIGEWDDDYIMDCRKNILSPSNINVNGTITYTTHGFPNGSTTGVTEVRCTATAGSTLPSGMPATAYLRAGLTNSGNTYTLHPTMSDAQARTNTITYGNTGSGNFIINSKTDYMGDTFNSYPFGLDFPVNYNPAQSPSNGTAGQRLISFTQDPGFYFSPSLIGPTPVETALNNASTGVTASNKAIYGVYASTNNATYTNQAYVSYPVRCRTNGTYPLRTDIGGGVRLNPNTTYWMVPRVNSSRVWLFATKADADAFIATNPTSTSTPSNSITLDNADYYGRLKWHLGNDGTYDVVNMGQSNIIPIPRWGIVPLRRRAVFTRILDCNNPSETFWTQSLYMNGTPIYENALMNNSDVRYKGLLTGTDKGITMVMGSPSQTHKGAKFKFFGALLGTSNTDPTSSLNGTTTPLLMKQFNITP
jgi:hypothetical protein